MSIVDISTLLTNIDIDIDSNIDTEILENIIINIDVKKEILENININKQLNRWEFGISNRASKALYPGSASWIYHSFCKKALNLSSAPKHQDLHQDLHWGSESRFRPSSEPTLIQLQCSSSSSSRREMHSRLAKAKSQRVDWHQKHMCVCWLMIVWASSQRCCFTCCWNT